MDQPPAVEEGPKRRPPASDEEWRRLRLRRKCKTLARSLEAVHASRPDVQHFGFRGLSNLPAYSEHEHEGLVHAMMHGRGRSLTILTATSQVFKKPDLGQRLFDIKRAAKEREQRVIPATLRGLVNELRRLCEGRSPALPVSVGSRPLRR
ncbi:MAG: hypothetical protein MIN69_02600 [Methylorubrum extorquens]|jgi:hypothetical protein|uniref:hypothetical protein n=1 Tax=Methylorubrum extorquens TaxID=408 RepID=UPI002FEE00A6